MGGIGLFSGKKCTVGRLVADPTKHIHRYRPPRYGPLGQQALITIWAASTFLGPVRLAGGMLLFVENLVTHGHLHVDDETRRLLLKMSPATIGRLLAGERKRYRLHGISHTRSTPLGGRIPIQTCMDPPLDIPGVLAVDLVGHDGGRAVDDFNWTLTVTDCTTGWTEAGAVRTKAEVYVVAALETCLRRYPGQVISLHADNGSEFMNGHLVRFCHARGITFTPEPFCPRRGALSGPVRTTRMTMLMWKRRTTRSSGSSWGMTDMTHRKKSIS